MESQIAARQTSSCSIHMHIHVCHTWTQHIQHMPHSHNKVTQSQMSFLVFSLQSSQNTIKVRKETKRSWTIEIYKVLHEIVSLQFILGLWFCLAQGYWQHLINLKGCGLCPFTLLLDIKQYEILIALNVKEWPSMVSAGYSFRSWSKH